MTRLPWSIARLVMVAPTMVLPKPVGACATILRSPALMAASIRSIR
jgi:hypothetical protein